MLDFLKPDLVKQFPSSSMDNPALLGQFAHTLAGQYREMFPPRRGFAVEVKERTKLLTRVSLGWEIRILHGTFGGTSVSLRPRRSFPQEILISAATTSRLHRVLLWVVAVPVVLVSLVVISFILHPFLPENPALPTSLVFVLVFRILTVFLAAIILATVGRWMAFLIGKLDHKFDANTRRYILATANRLPLPSILQYPQPPPPHPGTLQQVPPPPPPPSSTWPGVPPPPRPQ